MSESIFSMVSPERSLARKAGACSVRNECNTCNCPARAKVACILLNRSPREFSDELEIPPALKEAILRLPRDIFEFE